MFKLRNYKYGQLIFFWLIMICCQISIAADSSTDLEKVIVLGNESVTKFGTFLNSYEDTNGDVSPFELVLPEFENNWKAVTQSTINFGFEQKAYWLNMNIDASASIHKQWDLVISSPLLDYIDIYQVFPDSGPRLIYRSGMSRAFKNRNEDHRFFIAPLEIYNDSQNTANFLIRIQTSNSFYVPMQLYPANEFWAPLQQADILNWMFFGVILAMALYNFFLYLSVRDISYLFYVIFISSFAILHLSLDGYIFQHLWPAEKPYIPILDKLFLTSTAIFGLLFIAYFLDLKKYLPKLHYLIIGVVGFQLPLFIINLLYPSIMFDQFNTILMTLLLVSAVVIGLYSHYKGLVTARYFIVAWIVFAVGNLYLVVVYFGIPLFPVSPLVVSKVASFAEAMLLSFALAHRIRILRDDREKQQLKVEAQSYFLAQISHEIRTPLNGVLGTVDLLAQTDINKDQKEYIQIIQTSGQSLLSLVNDVLDYSKIEAGKMLVLDEQVEVHDLARHQVELFRSQAKDKKLELTLHIAPKVPKWITVDSQRLRQVWANLISNGIKFTDSGYVRVVLAIEREGEVDNLTFTVKDSGIGIAVNEIPNLYNAYQQAELGKRRVYGGTGLGLAICKELIELLNGQISVTSRLNQGSEFKVSIPLKLGTSTQDTHQKPEETLRPQLSILVAEDNSVNQKVISGLLTKLGHKVKIVSHGNKVVDERRKEDFSYDVIFMDCEMPQMDGYEATHLIRLYEKNYNVRRIPIIAITAHALEEVRLQCLNAGMDDFLTKPISTTQLVRSLDQIPTS